MTLRHHFWIAKSASSLDHPTEIVTFNFPTSSFIRDDSFGCFEVHVLSSAPLRRNFYRHKVTRVIAASVIAGSASTMRKPEIDYSFNVQLPFTMATLQWNLFTDLQTGRWSLSLSLSVYIYIIRTYRLIYSRASLRGEREIRVLRIYIFSIEGEYIRGEPRIFFSTIAKHAMTNTRP